LHYTFNDPYEEEITNLIPDGDFTTRTLQAPYGSTPRGSLEIIEDNEINNGLALKFIATANDAYTNSATGVSSSLGDATEGEIYTLSA